MQEKINLAILILAHRNFAQLKRLVSRFNMDHIDVFIHFDKKWKLTEAEYNYFSHENKVYICNNRISASIYLWSLVEATMELVNKSTQVEKEKGIHYHYFALLSGQDYPIKSTDYITTLLQKSYPRPFIDCTPYHSKNWLKRKFKTLPMENKILLYFINHWKPGKVRRILNFSIKLPIYGYFNILKIFLKTPYKKLIKENCDLYGGSAWWILPDKVINNIHQRYHDPNDKIVKFFSKTFSPEETFFQTMVMQSEVASMVELNQPFDTSQNCLTYAHFRVKGKPYTGHPHIFIDSDFDFIKTLPHCFARKFDELIDNDIINQIDHELLKYLDEVKIK